MKLRLSPAQIKGLDCIDLEALNRAELLPQWGNTTVTRVTWKYSFPGESLIRPPTSKELALYEDYKLEGATLLARWKHDLSRGAILDLDLPPSRFGGFGSREKCAAFILRNEPIGPFTRQALATLIEGRKGRPREDSKPPDGKEQAEALEHAKKFIRDETKMMQGHIEVEGRRQKEFERTLPKALRRQTFRAMLERLRYFVSTEPQQSFWGAGK